jgi:hypothetical protein
MPSSEITLRDLIAWTDHLLIDADGMTPHADNSDPLDRDVDWVISARATAPMLPTVRGGELVLLPERVMIETGLDLGLLVRELANHPVAAVVLDTDQPVRSPIPVLRTAAITGELESDLNRMLTTRRGDLLRAGTEIERIVTEHRSEQTSPEALLRALADHLGFTFTVLSATKQVVLTTSDSVASDFSGEGTGRLAHPLRKQRTLVVSGLDPDRLALGRLALGRAADAVQHALDHETSSVQDHATRTRLINRALTIASNDPRAAAAMLRRTGIQADGGIRVALAPTGVHERDIWPLLTALGAPLDAGVMGDHAVWLLQSLHQAPAPTVAPIDAWLALSAPIRDATDLGEAVRQVTFVAGARSAGLIGIGLIRFDDLARLGALRLLYDHWGTPTLDAFVSALIGPLLQEDRRGLLRVTLRAYLAFGGTQRLTAEHLRIHRNTLTYRLRQIRKLLAVDPDDPDTRLGLHLALLASELPPPSQPEHP